MIDYIFTYIATSNSIHNADYTTPRRTKQRRSNRFSDGFESFENVPTRFSRLDRRSHDARVGFAVSYARFPSTSIPIGRATPGPDDRLRRVRPHGITTATRAHVVV